MGWTEAWSSFAPVDTGWQNYDLYTNKGVPKGAIAHIIMANSRADTATTIGLRTDGSSIDRYIKIQEAEPSGLAVCSMLVKCHPTTGLIETYSDDVAGTTFYLAGYWTGIDFTELFETQAGSADTSYHDWDIYTAYGVPKGSVCQVICANYNDAAAVSVAIRRNGSAIDRNVNIGEAESASADTTDSNSIVMCVKTNVDDGIIEYRGGGASGTNVKYHLTGYFNSNMDYVEVANTAVAITSGDTWTDWDLTAYLDQDGRVVDVLCLSATTAATNTIGARKNGSSLERVWIQKEGEDAYRVGTSLPTETDASGIIEVISTDATNERTQFIGYFIATPIVEVYVTDSVTQGETVLRNKFITVSETVSGTDVEVCNKGTLILEVLAALDAITKVDKNLLVLETMTATDVLKTLKNLLLTDALEALDASPTVNKTFHITDALGATDASLALKTLLLEDELAAVDITVVLKTLILEDGLTTTDIIQVLKTLILEDGLSATDIAYALKTLILNDTISGDDALGVLKAILIEDTLGLSEYLDIEILTILKEVLETLEISDVAKVNKTLQVQDVAALTEALLCSKDIFVSDEVTSVEVLVTDKQIFIVDNLELVEALKRDKALLPIADGLSIEDALLVAKILLLADNLSFEDIIIAGRQMSITDAVSLAEVVKTDRNIITADALTLAEALLAHKHIITTDATTLEELILVLKTVGISDNVALEDAVARAMRIMLIHDYVQVAEGILTQKTVSVADILQLSEIFTKVRYLLVTDSVTLTELGVNIPNLIRSILTLSAKKRLDINLSGTKEGTISLIGKKDNDNLSGQA